LENEKIATAGKEDSIDEKQPTTPPKSKLDMCNSSP
jgi:hypothetical protein